MSLERKVHFLHWVFLTWSLRLNLVKWRNCLNVYVFLFKQEKCTFYPFSFNLEKKNTGRERNSRWGGWREQSTTNEERWLCVSENSRHHPVETSHLPLSSQSVSSFEFPGIVLEAQWDTHDTWPVVACQGEPFAGRGLTGWSKTIPGPGNAHRETTTGSLALTPCLPAVFSRSSCLDCSPHTPRTSLPGGHQGRFNWWMKAWCWWDTEETQDRWAPGNWFSGLISPKNQIGRI